MPVLAAYFAFSGAYLLVETGDRKGDPYKFFSFPYRYIKSMYGDFYDELRFNDDIINLVAMEMGKKIDDYSILVVNKGDTPKITFEPKLFLSLDRIYQTTYGVNPVYISNRLVYTKTEKVEIEFNIDELSSKEGRYSASSIDQELEYLNNYDIYPQLSAIDLPTRLDFDRNIVNQYRKVGHISELWSTLLFTGSKFAEKVLDTELDYVLIMDLISKPGIYSIYKDTKNAFPLLSLRNIFYKIKEAPPFEFYSEKVGTLIKIPGPLECFVGGEGGSGQVFDVPKDDLFVIPINATSVVDLTIKSPNLEKMVERKVAGGKVGLIFNSLENDKLISGDRRLLNSCIKYFNPEGGRI